MKAFLLFVVLYFTVNHLSWSQSSEQVVGKEIIYDFLNTVDYVKNKYNLLKDPADISNFLLNNNSFSLLDTLQRKGVLNERDINFIERQLSANENFEWERGKFKKARVIQRRCIIGNVICRRGFGTYSVPVFSIDKNVAIFYQDGYSRATRRDIHPLIARVYILRDNKWTLHSIAFIESNVYSDYF